MCIYYSCNIFICIILNLLLFQFQGADKNLVYDGKNLKDLVLDSNDQIRTLLQ